jgi:predicted RNA-binding Zn-ribbon protein involved in translation (DUF1610 family)
MGETDGLVRTFVGCLFVKIAFSERKDIPMKCDICSVGLAQGEGTVVSIKEMKTVVRNGFSPHRLGIATTVGALSVFGIQPEQMDEHWRKQVLADKTPWLLCASCYEKTRPFAGEGAGQTKVSKKRWPFGKKKAKLIEVANNWGVGDGTPLLVEQHPDLNGIFSNPNPQPPQRLTQRNRSYWASQSRQSIRYALAMAYLAHPDPQVCASTISLIGISGAGIDQMLVDLLANPSSAVRSAAVQAIWDRAKSPDPDANSVAFAIRCLRDETEGTGLVSHMDPQAARQALEVLRDAHPERRGDFDRWMIYAWCYSDDDLANYGYELLRIFSEHGTFLDVGEKTAGQIGAEIGSVRDRQVVQAAIQATIGSEAADELGTIWTNSLTAYIETLQESGDIDGLIEVLNSKEWEVREMAIEALGVVGDSRAASALQKTLDESRKREEFLQELSISGLSYDSKPVLQKVEEALGKIQSRIEAESCEGATKQKDQIAVTLEAEELQGSYPGPPSDDSSLLVSIEHESIQDEKECLLRRCGSCEQEVHPIVIDGRQYCPNCGASWAESQETVVLAESDGLEVQSLFCPHCEKVVLPSVLAGDSYCPDCGSRL